MMLNEYDVIEDYNFYPHIFGPVFDTLLAIFSLGSLPGGVGRFVTCKYTLGIRPKKVVFSTIYIGVFCRILKDYIKKLSINPEKSRIYV